MIFIHSKLKTKITEEAVWVAYPPMKNKWRKILPGEIERYDVRIYKALREYGGYGIKRRVKYGQSYTISGNVGSSLLSDDSTANKYKLLLEQYVNKAVGKAKKKEGKKTIELED